MKAYEKDASGAFVTGAGRMIALTLTAGSGAAATAYVHDNRSAGTGNKVAMVAAVAGTTHTLYLGPRGMRFENGLYVTLAGAGADAFAYVEND